tara:strand:- start:1336 stop:2871 length:1536 start_codon:yes stop_codon:yes gene_type:complete
VSDQEVSFEELCERLAISPDLRKHVAPDAPKKGKMAVARSMLPAPPKTLLAMMYLLIGDGDEEVVKAAQKGILGIPEQMLLGMLDKNTHPKILEFLAYRRPPEARLQERLALMPQLNDKTLFYLAETADGRLLEIIGSNQERMLVSPRVVYFLQRNPNTAASLLDRIKSFLRLYGIEIQEQAPDQEAAPKVSADTAEPAEPTQGAAQPPVSTEQSASADVQQTGSSKGPPQVELPDDFIAGEVYIPPRPEHRPPVVEGLINPLSALLSDWGITLQASFLAPPPMDMDAAAYELNARPVVVGADDSGVQREFKLPAIAQRLARADEEEAQEVLLDLSGKTSLQDSDFSFDLNEEQGSFDGNFTDDDKAEMDEEKKLSLRQQLDEMTVGEKIKLSYKANKGVREVLVRDTNKIVACAVVNSGRITDSEVLAIATNRSIHEEVIRALTSNREFMRKYPVKVALAGNPKTPIPTAISLLNSLHVKDLQKLASNRNVSSAVFTQAGKLYKRRKSGQ